MPKRFPKLSLHSAGLDQQKVTTNCVVKEKSLLRDIPYSAAPVVKSLVCQRPSVNEDFALSGCEESHDEIGKSCLPAAGRTNHCNGASCTNCKIYLGESMASSVAVIRERYLHEANRAS